MYQPLAEVIFPKYITGCMDTRSILAYQRVRNPSSWNRKIFLAPSHYLNQRLVMVNWTLRSKLLRNCNQNTKLFIHKMHLKISSVKWRPFWPGRVELMATTRHVRFHYWDKVFVRASSFHNRDYCCDRIFRIGASCSWTCSCLANQQAIQFHSVQFM